MDKFAMHNAAKCGDLKTVGQLVEEGVSVDNRDNKGRTPLHVAAKWGQYNVVQLLISCKCDINSMDKYGSTPVLTAACSGKKDVTDLLLRHGAQVNRANVIGVSLLHQASENGWADTVQHILNRGEEVDVNAAAGWGLTPLMVAAFADRGHEDCTEILLRAGADPNRRDAQTLTALHYAVGNGHTRIFRMLLGVEGLDLNPQDVNGWTPLHLACREGHRDIMREMLEAGADCTIRDNDGDTALSRGIRQRILTVEDIGLFVQHGRGIRQRILTVEDIGLFVQHGLYFQEKEYLCIFQDSILKEGVLKDASLCTQSVVNKFHRQSLPALKSISYYAEQLPNIDKFKLNAREIDEVEELVKCEIGRSNFCNVLKVHPISLKALCILTLITC